MKFGSGVAAGSIAVPRQNSAQLCNQEQLTADCPLPAVCLDVIYVPDPKAHFRYPFGQKTRRALPPCNVREGQR
jgi:hypothetical protein